MQGICNRKSIWEMEREITRSVAIDGDGNVCVRGGSSKASLWMAIEELVAKINKMEKERSSDNGE